MKKLKFEIILPDEYYPDHILNVLDYGLSKYAFPSMTKGCNVRLKPSFVSSSKNESHTTVVLIEEVMKEPI